MERCGDANGIGDGSSVGRREFLAATGTAGVGALAGCSLVGGPGSPDSDLGIEDFRGSGQIVAGRGAPGGTSITELPDLEGTLTFYLSFGEGGLYLDLIDLFAEYYPDFEYQHTQQSSSGLANRIVEEVEAGTSQADIFVAVDAGSLASVANAGATRTLPDAVLDAVPASLRSDQWVGIAGRARAVPYNANSLSASEVPDTVQDFPDTLALADSIGWAPTYSAFQSFVTAMRLLRGDGQTRDWLEAMLDHGVSRYPNEFVVSNSVANGEIVGGFANHYYALRVRNQRPDAPIELAFTSGDAGALINVSGAEIISGTDSPDLAENFIRHLLSAEAQEFFATRTFAYPTVPEVDPAGDLPSIDELNPPDIDLADLADVTPTIDLLRDTDVL
jgi:iron(III) transport system substrate-binding protein